MGDEAYGLKADEPLAQVSVWWAGDPDDPSNDDAYEPSGAGEPTPDRNHRLIGTWDYPAVNGRIRVGGGAEDAHGDPVRIIAESHGWYVFVWKFAGDDRVMSAASRYDDTWEHTRVTVPAETEEPPGSGDEDEPDRPLPVTGVDVAVAFVVAVSAVAVGAFMLAVIRRRTP